MDEHTLTARADGAPVRERHERNRGLPFCLPCAWHGGGACGRRQRFALARLITLITLITMREQMAGAVEIGAATGTQEAVPPDLREAPW